MVEDLPREDALGLPFQDEEHAGVRGDAEVDQGLVKRLTVPHQAIIRGMPHSPGRSQGTEFPIKVPSGQKHQLGSSTMVKGQSGAARQAVLGAPITMPHHAMPGTQGIDRARAHQQLLATPVRLVGVDTETTREVDRGERIAVALRLRSLEDADPVRTQAATWFARPNRLKAYVWRESSTRGASMQ